MIYFLHEPIDNAVKIGKTQDDKLMIRVSAIQIGNHRELKLLGVCEGYTKKEKELHKQFKHLSIRGEWFKYENELKEYIENNTEQYINPNDKFPKTLELCVKYLKNKTNLDEEVVNYIHEKYPYLKEIIDILGYDYIEKENYTHTNLKRKAIQLAPLTQKDKIKSILSNYIKENRFYNTKQIYKFLCDAYEIAGISKKPKSTEILNFYNAKSKVIKKDDESIRGFFIYN